MTKKNKSRKARRQVDQRLQKMKAGHLIQKAEALLTAGNYRESIKILKIASKKQPDDQAIIASLARAYAGREQQLRQKGMSREADALHLQGRLYRPDPAGMRPDDLVLFMETGTLPNAVDLYNRFLCDHKPDDGAEAVLLWMLLSAADWTPAEALSAHARLKLALPLLREALERMDTGDWEAGLECLRPVTRRSPLAPVKLLCRAMVCFHQEDDAGMQRALSMIPAPFGRYPLIERLKSAPQDIAPLWEGRNITMEQMQFLVKTIQNQGGRSIGLQIKRLAAAMWPQDEARACAELLQALMPLTRGDGIDQYGLVNLTLNLLPDRYGQAIAAKIYFLGFSDNLEDTEAYLGCLNDEFPDPAEHKMAASMVMTASVAWIVDLGLQHMVGRGFSQHAHDVLGVRSDETECILLEITLKALELDPHNRQAADLLTRLPRNSRKAVGLAQKGLEALVDHRPDDPQPCLVLAELYFAKNAYRKAQSYLAEAERRAPHDDRVNHFQVLALLRSIDANLKRGKYHLVKTDLENAIARGTKHTLGQVSARRILFAMTQTGQLSLFDDGVSTGKKEHTRAIIDHHLADLSADEALKALGLLAADCRNRADAWEKLDIKALEAAFRNRLKTVDHLPSKTVRKVIVPDVSGFLLPAGRLTWLDDFLSRKKKLLEHLNDQDILPVIDLLLAGRRFAQGLDTIRSRLKTSDPTFRALFRFYKMVVEYIGEDGRADGDALKAIVGGVPSQHLELFRSASQRLSKLARGPLKTALASFNFDNLTPWNALPFGFDDWDDDEEDFDEELLDAFDPGLVSGEAELLIMMVEALVDGVQLRGANEKTLERERKRMMKDPQGSSMLRDVARNIPPDMIGRLSPEAQYLLYK